MKIVRCVLAFVLVGCGARPPPPPVVIVPSTPIESQSEPLPAAVDPLSRFAGVWEDPSTAGRVHITIEVRHGVPEVVKIKESTGALEDYVVESSRWENGKLSFGYYVPSTSYTIAFEVQGVEGDTLKTTWSNQSGDSGTEDLIRVK